MGGRLRDVVDDGVSILLVDHDMGLVLGTCDQIVVLDFGMVLATGTPDRIRSDERVLAAYPRRRRGGLGRREGLMSVLELEGVSCGYGPSVVVRNLDLHVDGGEVVAVLGANGAGKTTTLLTIAGVLPAAGGQIRFLGERIERWPAPRIARHGAALVPDDRGLFPKLTVRENLALLRRTAGRDPWMLFPRSTLGKGHRQGSLRRPSSVATPGRCSGRRSCCSWTSSASGSRR